MRTGLRMAVDQRLFGNPVNGCHTPSERKLALQPFRWYLDTKNGSKSFLVDCTHRYVALERYCRAIKVRTPGSYAPDNFARPNSTAWQSHQPCSLACGRRE